MKAWVLERLRKLDRRLKRVLDVVTNLTMKVNFIMATQAELTTKLKDLGTQLTKVGNETTTLLTKIEELKVIVTNANVSPELQAAFDAMATQAQLVDDLVPDPPTP